ncbi:MAG: hypothetical protein IJ175_03385 [Clostridia bacterium]|nr:hypothetical protein [Clostridia bacterium]
MLIAALSLCGTLAGSVAGIVTGSRLVAYRLQQLEKKVEQHNRVIERTYALEGRMLEAEHDIRELKGR